MKFNHIQKTPLFKAFSDIGKRIFLPDGIFYWSGRAKKEAEIIGTIGTAYGFEKDFIDGGSTEWLPCYIKEISEYSKFSIKKIVPYSAIGGISQTREIWKDWILRKSMYDDITEKEKYTRLENYITTPEITGGVTNAIFQCCSLFLNPGESIIVPSKRWGNYDNIVNKFIGAKIASFNFFKDNRINIEGLRIAIEQVAKKQEKIILLLNFPNNPTGYVPTLEEANDIVNLLKDCQKDLNIPFIVLVDDAYEPFIYKDDVLNKSIFYNLHQLNEDVIPIKLDGITKELLIYGGRIGFITIGLKPHWVENEDNLNNLKAEINNKLEGFTRATISNCNHFYQTLTQKMFIEKGIDKIIKSRDKVKNLLKARYDKINSEINQINNSNFSIDPNSGGFFLFVNLNPTKIKANEFADHLLKKYKVGVIPIEKPDYGVNGIRIAYCSIDLNDIPEMIKRFNLALNDF